MYHNLRKDLQCWGMISELLMNTGATMRSHGVIYKAVEQTMLLYRSGIWVVTGATLKVLDSFHHQADWRIA